MQKPTETINITENESTGLTPKMMRIRTRLDSVNSPPIVSNPTPKKRNRDDSDDESYIVPPDFDINNSEVVKSFIDSLNDSQLRVVFLKNGIIKKGDIKEKPDIYSYFINICRAKGFVKHKKKKVSSYLSSLNKSDIPPQPNFDFDVSEIIIPAGFDIKNFKSVKKFIDSLNAPQLQKVLDRQFLAELGDIQEDRIKEYFKAACGAKGVKKTKKKSKKAAKVVKEWDLKDDE
jgi:hypothetical protein